MITKKGNNIEIVIPKKFSEKQIGEFMNKFRDEYNKLPLEGVVCFDFTQTEWIANQNLLLLSGIIKYLYHSEEKSYHFEKKFKVKLLPYDYEMLNKRKVEQICELWYIWQFRRIFDKKPNDFENYIERFDNNTLENLCKLYGISFDKYTSKRYYNLYDDFQFSVVPFVSLNYIFNARYENTMNAQLKPVYELNQVINKQLEDCECKHPFAEKTISAIITKELYDNFLDHFEKEKSIFKCNQDWAFMSISLKRKHSVDNQILFKCNFNEEELKDAESFFFDNGIKKYKNKNLIQFSFVDFGAGIVETLKKQYKKENHIPQSGLFTQVDDNDVLKYAFKHNSSQNPILDKYDKIDNYIPRGLYDLLVIVKRYNGLLIVRSNYGKILYNFSETNNIEDSICFFDKDKKEYFPGTYMSIYIPAWEKPEEFDKSVIQPEYRSLNITNKPKKSCSIDLFSIISKLDTDPKFRYKQLIEKLSQELEYDEKINRQTYLSFLGVTDTNIIRKTIFYLIGSKEVNEHNSIIIVNPPSKGIITEINNRIIELDKDGIVQDYSIQPIPLIYLDIDKKEINLDWIGIFIDEDKKKLTHLLFDVHSLVLQDLKDGYKAVGNTNKIDKFDNFSSNLPKEKELLTYYTTTIVEDAIKEYDCLKEKKSNIYLCNGNYYQESFLQLTDVLNSRKYGNVIPAVLLDEIKLHIKKNNPKIKEIDNEIIYIAITASSHKILNSLTQQEDDKEKQLIKEKNCLFLDSYLNFENEIQDKIKENMKYVLVCDAIATGNLTMRLESIIEKHKSQLIAVAVIANTLDTSFDGYDNFRKEFIDKKRFIYLSQFPIKKYRREYLSDKQKQKVTTRINPYTNIPITLSDEITNQDSILLSNDDFLEYIENDDIEIRFKLFNNLIHPYFFKTAEILKREIDKIRRGDNTKSIIHKIFSALKVKDNYEDADYIFYPKNSDIKHLKIKKLLIETKILGKGGVNYFELERYNPGNGWKFPHTTEYCKEEITGKTILILDDGSCSGDSLYQMINELSYYDPRTINVLSIIGRVEDHKREFFSKIKLVKGTKRYVRVNIYFGTHWHIPTFYHEINPYSDEIKWLNEIDKLSNVPEKIKTNAEKIKNEIIPKSDKEIQKEIEDKKRKSIDYSFFPKTKDTEEIPKKEILTVRNEVGKVICYRFYRESFKWFDKHITKEIEKGYQERDENVKKHLEELLMCFLYEPYLYLELIRAIPEIKSLVEKFVENIIFEQRLKIEDLQYKWRISDIVHLFFIAYQDDRLIEKLDLPKFKEILQFSESKVNYVLYKLFYYSPLNKEQYRDIFAKIKTEIIVAYLSPQNQNQDIDKNIKLFNYFIESLPGKGSFRDILKEIHEEYKRISDIEYHKENINNKIESSLNCLNAIKKDRTNLAAYNILLKNLDIVISFVSKILSISKSQYNPYFSEHLSLFESNDEYSLRKIQGRLAIFLTTIFRTRSLKEDEIESIYTDIIKLQDNFFDSYSIPYKIFHKISIENITERINNYKNEINQTHKYKINNYSSLTSVYFSDYIFEDIVLKNIFGNFGKYADQSENINIEIKDKDEKFIEITITNKSNEQYANGALIGTYQINQLNKCPNNLFLYSTGKYLENNTLKFKQIITLKKI